jgi:hypothetical protein
VVLVVALAVAGLRGILGSLLLVRAIMAVRLQELTLAAAAVVLVVLAAIQLAALRQLAVLVAWELHYQ